MDELLISREPSFLGRFRQDVSRDESDHFILHSISFILLSLGGVFCKTSVFHKPIFHSLNNMPHAPEYSHSVTEHHAYGIRFGHGAIDDELGGTWAQNDKRHNGDPWTQVDAALHLEKLGYELFLTHGHRWLHVESDFFQVENNPATDEEGFGPFVQGNLLAMHATFTPRLLRQLILQDATFVQRTRKC